MMLILVVYVSKIIYIFAFDDLLPNIWLKVSDDSVEPSLPVYTKSIYIYTYLCKYQLRPQSVQYYTHVGQYVMIDQLPLPDWCEIRSTPSSSFDAKSNIPQSPDLIECPEFHACPLASLIPSTSTCFLYIYMYIIPGVYYYIIYVYICNFFSSICIFFSSLDYQFTTGKH
jgi:hypothetical protein